MRINAIAASLSLLLLLSGCGSDNDNKTEIPETKPINPNAEYVVMDVNPKPIVNKTHRVTLGRYDDQIKIWMSKADPVKDDLDKDGRISVYDAEIAGIVNEPINYKLINSADVVAFLTENPDGHGQHTARPDIFVEGQYSVFDVLRYFVYTDDKLKFDSVTPADESPFKTTEFTISYDENGDGDFTNEEAEYMNSENWYFRFKTSGGDFMRAIGEPDGEATYQRMDEMWAQNDLAIRFQPFHEVTTARRHYIWQKEIERLESNNGYILEEITLKNDVDPAPYTYVKNLEVTAHNLRPDVFQPGVITSIDWYMSAIDAGYDFKLSYWPTLDTGAKVNSYSINHADGLTSTAGKGWISLIGEKETGSDYNSGTPKCLWDKGGHTISQGSAFPRSDCIDDYHYRFGGNVLHVMTDVLVAKYPKQFAMLIYSSHYPQWGMEEFNGDQPGKEYDFGDGDTAAIEKLFAETDPESDTILTDRHYGWGKANCLLCHNAENGHKNGAPLPINSVDGFDTPQPYFCSTCHGGNGAPSGHGATARCFWCHSNSKTPEFHGDAFSRRSVESKLDAINEEREIYFNPENGTAVMTRDSATNPTSYPDTGVKSGANSDWSMSKTFPDPYSCMTCHSNK